MDKKNEVVQRLNASLRALNCITVNGKQNLSNLFGAISVIEDAVQMIDGIEFKEDEVPASEK